MSENPGGRAGAEPRIETDPHGDVTVDRVALAEELAGSEATAGHAASADVAEYALRLGDDALVLSQRLGDWISRAPELEEDVALANIALDLLGHARSLLHYAGTHDGRSEDDLAYFRDEPDFRNAPTDIGRVYVGQLVRVDREEGPIEALGQRPKGPGGAQRGRPLEECFAFSKAPRN